MYISDNKNLLRLQKILMGEYLSYRDGTISEKEYLIRAKPLDEAISKLEMATLQGILVLKGSSSSVYSLKSQKKNTENLM